MKNEKYSPDAVVGRVKKLGLFSDEEVPCTTTLYNYINLGFMGTKNIDLHSESSSKNQYTKKPQEQDTAWRID
ncbi:hypothetical protein ABW365_12070 [Enterococcus avium]